MKILKICIIAVCVVALNCQIEAQTEKKTKIIVVEKTTDNNGNVVTHRIEKSGEEADEYIKLKEKELGIKVELDGDTRTTRKEVNVEMSNENRKERKKIRIKVMDDEGEEKLLEWDGEGAMSEEMKTYLKEEGIDVNVGLGEEDISVVVNGQEVVDIEEEINVKIASDDGPKLGVVPQNHVEGVEILEILQGSAAEQAKLQTGDIIFKVNDWNIGSILQLSDRLERVEKGNEAIIEVLRNGKPMKIKVTL